jgi:hypothetical protein
MPCRNTDYRPQLELLEDRITPADISVTFRGNSVIIKGSRSDDSIQIEHFSSVGNVNTYIVWGLGSTTINGGLPFVNQTFSGKKPPSWSINLGRGNDYVEVISTMNINGIFGRMNFKLGAGNDTLNLLDADIAKLNANMGKGNDSVFMDSFFGFQTDRQQAGNANFKMGAGNDFISISDTDFTRNARVDLGKGTDTLNVGLFGFFLGTTTVFNNFTIKHGNGPGTVTIHNLLNGGKLNAKMGNGPDSFTMNSSDVVGRLSINMGGGGGVDNVTLRGSTSGGLNIKTGGNKGGTETVMLDIFTVLGSGRAVINMGGGNDDLQIWEGKFGGNVNINMGGGQDTVLITGYGIFGGITTSTFRGKVKINLGGKDDTLTLDYGTKFDNKKPTQFIGGSGTDTFIDNGAVFLTAPKLKDFP